jgi:hypothetical protein
MNFWEDAVLTAEDGEYRVECRDLKARLPEEKSRILASKGVGSGKVVLGIRPVYLRPSTDGLEARILSLGAYWDETHIFLDSGGTELISVVPSNEVQPGWVPGARLLLSAEGRRMHLFDPETGASLF